MSGIQYNTEVKPAGSRVSLPGKAWARVKRARIMEQRVRRSSLSRVQECLDFYFVDFSRRFNQETIFIHEKFETVRIGFCLFPVILQSFQWAALLFLPFIRSCPVSRSLLFQLLSFIDCLQCRRPGFDAWIGKIPWSRRWQPTPVSLPGESHR